MNNITYYESRVQYQVAAIVFLLVFLIVTVFNIGDLGKVAIYFLLISIFALIFLSVYRPSVFELTDKDFTWKKGKQKIISPWSEVIAIHYDLEPVMINAFRKFRSSGFFIETKSGMTMYADKANIKQKGVSGFTSKGNELISEIIKRSSAVEKTGEISMFKQTQKLRDITLLILGIFLVPVIIIGVYVLVFGFI